MRLRESSLECWDFAWRLRLGDLGSGFNLTFWLYLVILKFEEMWFLYKFSCSRSIEMGSNFALQSAWSREIMHFLVAV
jgi:hypothetical protein